MRLRALIIGLCLALAVSLDAAVVHLQSGQVVEGEILVHNDDVIIIRNASGARFQYPASEVTAIDEDVQTEVTSVPQSESASVSHSSKVALRLSLAGGADVVPGLMTGGGGEVNLQLGSRILAGRRLFLGGSVGLHYAYVGSSRLYIPLQLAVSVPLMDGTHSPEVGAELGYGFSTIKHAGGLCGGAHVDWRYQFSDKSALLLGLYARFQMTEFPIEETIDNLTYTAHLGRTIVYTGLHMGLEF